MICWRRFLAFAVLGVTTTLLSPPLPPARAQDRSDVALGGEAGFQAYLRQLGARARAEGVREATVARMTAGLTENPRVVALDRSQPGSSTGAPPPMSSYLRTHVDAARIGKGRALYSAMGHAASAYAEPEYRGMLLGAVRWALRKDGAGCDAPASVAPREVSER